MSEKMREALIAYIEAGVGNSTDYEKQADARSLAMEALAAKPAQGEAVDSMGMPISCGKPLCSVNDHHPLCRLYAAPPAPSVPDEMAKISAIAHDGGLAGLSESDALTAIRRITAKHWSTKHATVEARRALVLAAAPEVPAPSVPEGWGLAAFRHKWEACETQCECKVCGTVFTAAPEVPRG